MGAFPVFQPERVQPRKSRQDASAIDGHKKFGADVIFLWGSRISVAVKLVAREDSMKRFQSAFAAPSGFVVAVNAGKAGRRGEMRAADVQAPAIPAKPRIRDIRDRAA